MYKPWIWWGIFNETNHLSATEVCKIASSVHTTPPHTNARRREVQNVIVWEHLVEFKRFSSLPIFSKYFTQKSQHSNKRKLPCKAVLETPRITRELQQNKQQHRSCWNQGAY